MTRESSTYMIDCSKTFLHDENIGDFKDRIRVRVSSNSKNPVPALSILENGVLEIIRVYVEAAYAKYRRGMEVRGKDWNLRQHRGCPTERRTASSWCPNRRRQLHCSSKQLDHSLLQWLDCACDPLSLQPWTPCQHTPRPAQTPWWSHRSPAPKSCPWKPTPTEIAHALGPNRSSPGKDSGIGTWDSGAICAALLLLHTTSKSPSPNRSTTTRMISSLSTSNLLQNPFTRLQSFKLSLYWGGSDWMPSEKPILYRHDAWIRQLKWIHPDNKILKILPNSNRSSWHFTNHKLKSEAEAEDGGVELAIQVGLSVSHLSFAMSGPQHFQVSSELPVHQQWY